MKLILDKEENEYESYYDYDNDGEHCAVLWKQYSLKEFQTTSPRGALQV